MVRDHLPTSDAFCFRMIACDPFLRFRSKSLFSGQKSTFTLCTLILIVLTAILDKRDRAPGKEDLIHEKEFKDDPDQS